MKTSMLAYDSSRYVLDWLTCLVVKAPSFWSYFPSSEQQSVVTLDVRLGQASPECLSPTLPFELFDVDLDVLETPGSRQCAPP